MATKRSEKMNPLLESLPDLPTPPRNGVVPWHERMRVNDPQKYQWMMELVNEFVKGSGPIYAKLRSTKNVYEYLRSKGFIDDSVSESTFRGWLGKVGK